MREISAGIILYRKTEEGIKYLILYHRGRYWNFPKGKIESEEKSFQAALREVKEETGLDRKDMNIHENFKAYENFTFVRRDGEKRGRVYKTIIFYLAETDKKQIKLTGPHEEGYCWFTYREAMKILSAYKDSQKVLKMANDFLRPPTQRIRQIKPNNPKSPTSQRLNNNRNNGNNNSRRNYNNSRVSNQRPFVGAPKKIMPESATSGQRHPNAPRPAPRSNYRSNNFRKNFN